MHCFKNNNSIEYLKTPCKLYTLNNLFCTDLRSAKPFKGDVILPLLTCHDLLYSDKIFINNNHARFLQRPYSCILPGAVLNAATDQTRSKSFNPCSYPRNSHIN